MSNEGPGEARSEGTVAPKSFILFHKDFPDKNSYGYLCPQCHMYSPPAFEKHLSDLCNLCSNDSEEKGVKVGGEKGRKSQKKKEEEKETKVKERRSGDRRRKEKERKWQMSQLVTLVTRYLESSFEIFQE